MFNIGDKVKRKHSISNEIGTVIGFLEDNEYVYNKDGVSVIYAYKGEIKVFFESTSLNGYIPFKYDELIKL